MASLVKFGNDLYTGARSYNFVGNRRIWYVIALVLVLVSIVVPILRGGFLFGIEFRGGSEFQISGVEAQPDQQIAIDTVTGIVPEAAPQVTLVGDEANRSVRVQTEQLGVRRLERGAGCGPGRCLRRAAGRRRGLVRRAVVGCGHQHRGDPRAGRRSSCSPRSSCGSTSAPGRWRSRRMHRAAARPSSSRRASTASSASRSRRRPSSAS